MFKKLDLCLFAVHLSPCCYNFTFFQYPLKNFYQPNPLILPASGTISKH